MPVAIFSIVLVLLAGNFMGCEPEDWMFAVDCNDCYGNQPDSAKLIVYLTIDSYYDSVPITIYKGSFEEGLIDWQDTATTEEFLLYSAIDQEYTVRATYKSGLETIVAFDGDNMHIYDGGDECGSPCYIVKGGIFDVQLLE